MNKLTIQISKLILKTHRFAINSSPSSGPHRQTQTRDELAPSPSKTGFREFNLETCFQKLLGHVSVTKVKVSPDGVVDNSLNLRVNQLWLTALIQWNDSLIL